MERRFEHTRGWPAFVGYLALMASGCGESALVAEEERDEVGSISSALAGCQVNANGSARCNTTAIPRVSGRNVYYRIGALTGPGYDAATGRHAAVVLFQGTSASSRFTGDNGSGGANGPGATWNADVPLSRDFGIWYQVATVIALVDAGYTVIQPAARRQCGNVCAYAWDSNLGTWNGSPDQALTNALVAEMQPGRTTFGAIDINHVYAMGASSGGYMTSRLAHEYAGGLDGNGTVISTLRPFRAVAIQSGAYQGCLGNECSICEENLCSNTPDPVPNPNHPPTFFLHDVEDRIVPYPTMVVYRDILRADFGNGSPAYTVNGVPETFLREDNFDGTPQQPHHSWDRNLKPDSTNLILDWFRSHR